MIGVDAEKNFLEAIIVYLRPRKIDSLNLSLSLNNKQNHYNEFEFKI